ncbi:transglutaminase [Hahella sp. CCB-MM4]|uniref:transglutaminase-like domain-containing protein n=1 Tax=Hahella sp. (strain CCB-MM4) TaxID=1926491 RepID=UPI000B9B0DEF|nr:transglutaminase family protein [Hahella sp. CCB-MM4]OZG70742.1 transglutaminase [Hahella sp. CCB-MM4]
MNLDDREYLIPTRMLDYQHPQMQKLVEGRGWRKLAPFDAIGAIYAFVRDEIRFGYNRDDSIPASAVLTDGYGQCNTKGTLLMALLRAVGIPARIHGFTIYNELQRGAIPNYLMPLAPERIIHSWVEVLLEKQWINLEGYIIDRDYLDQVQRTFADQCDEFSGYGVATTCLKRPQVDWSGKDTYIQKEGIADDYGVFAQPDEFYQKYGSNLSGLKRRLFRYLLRHLLNWNVDRIRRKGLPVRKTTSIGSTH